MSGIMCNSYLDQQATNQNGHYDINVSGESDPLCSDTDHDGIKDGVELGLTVDDVVKECRINNNLIYKGTNTTVFGVGDMDAGATVTSMLDNDTDGDGILDGMELGIKENTDGSIKNIDQSGYDYNRSTGGDSYRFYTDPSRMDTDEDGVTDYIELQGWDVIVIHERRGEVMEDRCEYGVWSLPLRYDSEGDGANKEMNLILKGVLLGFSLGFAAATLLNTILSRITKHEIIHSSLSLLDVLSFGLPLASIGITCLQIKDGC